MSQSVLTKFDDFLNHSGPAAIVLRDELVSVEGSEGVIMPPTFAAGDNFEGGYNIDPPNSTTGENVCLIDTHGSQANRMEVIFLHEPYDKLVPQVKVIAGEHTVNLLEAGHRAADAIVRCSSLQDELSPAFRELQKGDAGALAKIAPTTFVFGAWDSRHTQVKLQRMLASVIRAYNVVPLRRSATYIPPVEYIREGLVDEPTDKKEKSLYSDRGFQHAVPSGTHGGVIPKGGVRREAVLSLVALRLLSSGGNDTTLALRRYLFGLAAVAFTAPQSGLLRQGCILVPDLDKPNHRVLQVVYPNGERKDFDLEHQAAITYAEGAAKAFGVGKNRTVEFDKDRAKRDIETARRSKDKDKDNDKDNDKAPKKGKKGKG